MVREVFGMTDESQSDEVGAETLAALQAEVAEVRARLADLPGRSRLLEERLLETRGQLADALARNDRLTDALRETRENLAVLREEVQKLSQPPSAYGVITAKNDDGSVDILTGGRKMRVNTSVEINAEALDLGAQVVLNESLNVILATDSERVGEIVTLKSILEDGIRVIVSTRGDDERVLELCDALRGQLLRAGDLLRADTRSGFVLERLPQPEVDELLLLDLASLDRQDLLRDHRQHLRQPEALTAAKLR